MIRAATLDDIAAITQIYAHYVQHSTATFEEAAPTPDQMAERMGKILQQALPYLVIENDSGAVIGYAYAGAYNLRAAYRYTVEDSIYLAADSVGKGHGNALLSALITACVARGIRQMLAVISGPPGASHHIHAKLGFVPIGHAISIGYKFNAWHDVRYMQRALGPGDASAPSAKGGILAT
jgi:L-amino acid N-acyltransferase YncA